MNRAGKRSRSNNPHNPNKNICTQALCVYLGVAEAVRYLHTIGDVKRAARVKYSVRSVLSSIKSKTVGGARKHLHDIGAEYFICWVDGHVVLLGTDGDTLIDTDPRVRDRRKLIGIWACYPK